MNLKHLVLYIFFFLPICLAAKESRGYASKIDSLQAIVKSVKLPISGEFASETPTLVYRVSDTNYVKALNELGWELKRSNPDTSILLSNQALYVAQEIYKITNLSNQGKRSVEKGIARAYNCLGVYNRAKGNFVLALQFYQKALDMIELIDDKDMLSATLGNMGVIYSERGDYKEALSYFNKSLAIARSIEKKIGVGIMLGDIAIVYDEQGEYEKALEYDFEALKVAEELNDSLDIARYYGNLGNVNHSYAKKMRSEGKPIQSDSLFTRALDFYFKAVDMSKLLDDKTGLTLHLGNIGSTYLTMQRYDESEKFLFQSLRLARELGMTVAIKNQLKGLSDVYKASKKPELALNYYEQYVALRDSLFNEENTKNIVRAEMNYEFDKKQTLAKLEQEKKNIITLKEKQNQHLLLIFFSVFLILISVFAIFLYNRWRLTQKQKQIIEKQKENIVDSINYAQHIQQSILVDETEIQKALPDSFIYYQPKDIVSGDFYWFSLVDGKVLIAAVDCTGHGVPGAFMSMIGNTLLNQIVNEKKITKPSDVLNLLHTGIFEALHQKKGAYLIADGMDISFCSIDFTSNELQYAGARNSLYWFANKELTIISADRKTIGDRQSVKTKVASSGYTNHTIPLMKGMNIYLFTDGYADQFNGNDKTKFGIARFKNLIAEISHLSMSAQKQAFEKAHEEWRKGSNQIDDILLIGIKIN
jgi:serine phosphatase RsbU (regulator of sigma subunit)